MPSAKLLTCIRPVCLQRRRKAPWRLPGRLCGARRLRSVLQPGRQGQPSPHSAATGTIRALGQAGHPVFGARPYLLTLSAPEIRRGRSRSPSGRPWDLNPKPGEIPATPRARAPEGRGLGEARPRRGDREVSAGTASAPRVLARVCRLRTRSRDYPFLPLFCVCAWGSNWCVRLEGGASLET